MISTPSITFVTVNYNSGKKVCSLIESIRTLASDFEIIVVDNASTDASRDLLAKVSGSDLRCIFNDKNIGYGRANNVGVAAARANVIVLINPDAVLDPSNYTSNFFVDNLMDASVGIVAPSIVYPNGCSQPNFSQRYSSIQTFVPQLLSLGVVFRYFNSKGFCVGLAGKLGIVLFGNAGNEYVNRFKTAALAQNCAWVSGACVGIRRDVFLDIGGFDERFFLYSEDEDLCRRIRLKGLLIRYNPEFTVIHEVGGTHEKKLRIGDLGWSDIYRIHSGLIYLAKYQKKGWRRVKVLYLLAVTVRLFAGLFLFLSPLQSWRLLTRIVSEKSGKKC